MGKQVPVVLSVGGWDPCGGAGLAADIKTFEANGVRGMGVCSAITSQVEDSFNSLKWVDSDLVQSQICTLLGNYHFDAVKFGIIKSIEQLAKWVHILKKANDSVNLVWDPVLKASAGHDFHARIDTGRFFDLIRQITLLTPNLHEAESLFGSTEPVVIQEIIRRNASCKVLLKGGHAGSHANDVLIDAEGITVIEGVRFINSNGKHGSGCVFSAAVCASLAKGASLSNACELAKRYTESFILSDDGLLGWHSFG